MRRGCRGRSDRRGAEAATAGGNAAFHAISRNRPPSRTLGRRHPRPHRGDFLAAPSGDRFDCIDLLNDLLADLFKGQLSEG